MRKERSLVIGAAGQIGIELVIKLKEMYGAENVIAADIRPPHAEEVADVHFEHLNILNHEQLESILEKHKVDVVYQLAALLSASAEKQPDLAWDLNMNGLFHILNAARKGLVKRVFWPSSIAVFGPTTPSVGTPQITVCEPNTIYGISKLAGERWCEYYHAKFGVDVRSLRYPGLIGHRSLPGGGTTDYAVDIFYKALERGSYESFLSADTRLPMMYIEEAIRATIELMEAPAEKIKIRSSYNLSGIDFTPLELAEAIKKDISDFTISYAPDFRQKIADSWPQSIDDSVAQSDWGWKTEQTVDDLVSIMLTELRKKKLISETSHN
ncbi:MAG: NAD-dependent epimerase/dehydratase family protein [Cryomorphaceae bacterium]|nr:NAD-dependent epimerase/dehydratase family protein [Cryomorphaceae bacterium]